MNSALDAFLRSWPSEPGLVAMLAASGAVYFRGWRKLRRHDADRWNFGRLATFWGGLLTIFAALASPIEPFANLLLQVHMLQHMLLLVAAPPLIWLGAPLLPMLRGLPKRLRVSFVVPILRSPVVRDAFTFLVHPLVAWPLLVGVVWLWHSPRGYELALDDPAWHVIEHLSFTVAALLFWFPVVLPYPSRPRWSRWIVLPYLILADVQNTILAAWLTFAAVPIYPHYSEVPRVGGWSPLADQHVAGVLMWVPGSLAFLLPVCVIGVRMLYGPSQTRTVMRRKGVPSLGALPVLTEHDLRAKPRVSHAPAWDLLRVPLVGRFLRRRWARPGLQLIMLGLAVLVILDGLLGPRVGPANLAGVAPWIHWRGLVMLGLLVGGNLFCMACPFTLPRKLAQRWLPEGRSWPRALRSKWLAIVLVALFLWSYEAFSLWNSPWLTAWIAVAYFVAAFAVDGLFRGAAFCKYVCPIGQFNFVQSLVSPLEVGVRQPAICAGCSSKECIRGSAAAAGCGMQLFQPRKNGNFDCTFCFDCVQACPHENVGVFATFSAGRLADTRLFRSGIGRLGQRGDVAALVLLLVFGAFANAGGMIGPVVAWQDDLRLRFGNPPHIAAVSVYYFIAIVVAPLMVVSLAAMASGLWNGTARSLFRIATRYAYALIPLGFGMWLAHHGFHLFTSYGTIVPVAQRMTIDFGFSNLTEPQWQHACCLGVADWIIKFELLALDVGLIGSLMVAYRVAVDDVGQGRRALAAMLPWALVICTLFAIGVWIVLEPMQMRGTLPMGG